MTIIESKNTFMQRIANCTIDFGILVEKRFSVYVSCFGAGSHSFPFYRSLRCDCFLAAEGILIVCLRNALLSSFISLNILYIW